MGAVAEISSVAIFELGCELVRLIGFQHLSDALLITYFASSGWQSEKCWIVGRVKLKIVSNAAVPHITRLCRWETFNASRYAQIIISTTHMP